MPSLQPGRDISDDVRRGLPPALADLLLVCLVHGLGRDAAVGRQVGIQTVGLSAEAARGSARTASGGQQVSARVPVSRCTYCSFTSNWSLTINTIPEAAW